MRITADEARKLSGLTAQEEVNAVYPLIREAATKGQRYVLVRTDFWRNEGYSVTAKFAEAIGLLKADGFDVDWFCEDSVSDMGLIVRW